MTFHHDSGRLVLSADVLTTEFYAFVGEEGARKMGRERRAARCPHWLLLLEGSTGHTKPSLFAHAGALKPWASLETPLALTEEQEPLRSVVHLLPGPARAAHLGPRLTFHPTCSVPFIFFSKNTPLVSSSGGNWCL